MVHLRPDVFVVFDRVESPRANLVKTWLLHTIDEPQLQGPRFTVTDGQGQLLGRTFLPAKTRTRSVGGPGKEFWVNGRNWPPTGGKTDSRAGAWRIEVSPSQSRHDELFLHLLEAGGKGDPARVTNAKLVRDGKNAGLEFTYQGRHHTVLFATSGPPRLQVKIAAGGLTLEEASIKSNAP